LLSSGAVLSIAQRIGVDGGGRESWSRRWKEEEGESEAEQN
jgi:hypothetical protein